MSICQKAKTDLGPLRGRGVLESVKRLAEDWEILEVPEHFPERRILVGEQLHGNPMEELLEHFNSALVSCHGGRQRPVTEEGGCSTK